MCSLSHNISYCTYSCFCDDVRWHKADVMRVSWMTSAVTWRQATMRVRWAHRWDTATIWPITAMAAMTVRPPGRPHAPRGGARQSGALPPGGWGGEMQHFIMPLRTEHNLTLTNCLFPEFSTEYFQTMADHRKPRKSKPWIEEEPRNFEVSHKIPD